MSYYSQRDARWANKKIGKSTSTIGMEGCFGTALGNLCGKTPVEVFDILYKNGFLSGDLIISSENMAKLLGLEFHGIDNMVTRNPEYRTIAQVDMSTKAGIQSHFVVIKEDGSIIDSWTGTIRPKGTYPLVGYRLFKVIETPIVPEPIKEVKKPVIVNSSPTEQSTTLNPVEAPNNSTMTPIQEVQAVGGDVDLDIPIQHQEIPKDSYDLYTEKPVENWLITLIKKLINYFK